MNTLRCLLREKNIIGSSGKINPNAVRVLASNVDIINRLIQVTNFLPNDVQTRERLYCVINNITKTVTCLNCSIPVRIKRTGRLEYPTYCSRDCSNQSSHRHDRITQTMLNRYGVKYTAQSKTLLSKMQQTCIERYGVSNPFKLDLFQKKKNQTIQERYNVTNIMNVPEIRERHRLSCTNKNFVKINSKIKKTTKINQGYFNVLQKHLTDEQIKLLNDVEFLSFLHYIEHKTLIEIADIINVDSSTISLYFKKHNLVVHRFSSSTGEQEIIDELFKICPNLKIKRNDRKILKGKELDIYLPDFKLAIEYCGLYWHADLHDRIDKNYHKLKYDMCKKQGIQLITLFEDEWKLRKIQVINKLRSLLGMLDAPAIYARNTSIILVDTKQKCNFFEQNHIQGNGLGSINIGLQYNGLLISCISFSKYKHEIFYLTRYATSCHVVGGLSKLLSYFKRQYNWSQIVSFADLRWSDGNLYQQTGWTLHSVLPVDYFYSPDGITRFHKFNYRRKALPSKLKYFDPQLSEKQNCDNNKILRIWDCGKLRYVMHNELFINTIKE